MARRGAECALVGREPGINILDFTSYLCPTAMCPAARGRVLFYRDNTHMTATLARAMEPAMAAELDRFHLMPKRK